MKDDTLEVIVCQSISFHYYNCNFLKMNNLFHIVVTTYNGDDEILQVEVFKHKNRKS